MQYVDVENIASDSEGNTVLFSGEDFITCYRPGRAFFEDVYIPGVRAAEIVTVWSEAPRVFCTLGAGRRVGALPAQRRQKGKVSCGYRRQLSARPDAQAFFKAAGSISSTPRRLWRYTYKDESLVLLSDLAAAGRNRALPVSTVCSFGDEVYVGSWPGPWAVFPRKEAAAS